MLGKTVLRFASTTALSMALSLLSTKVEDAIELENREVLPRILITLVIGGVVYLVSSEFSRRLDRTGL